MKNQLTYLLNTPLTAVEGQSASLTIGISKSYKKSWIPNSIVVPINEAAIDGNRLVAGRITTVFVPVARCKIVPAIDIKTDGMMH